MFTGLVEEIGKIRTKGADSLAISCCEVQKDLAIGDSVAVNGVCLTVIRFDSASITAEVMPVTLRTTNLGSLNTGDGVHLERAMRLGDRVGGHLVAGHVDATTQVLKSRKEKDAVLVTLEIPDGHRPFIISKGSVSLDGISLTVAELSECDFTVSLVGHTREHTLLAEKKSGELVNLECDQIGKYVHHQIAVKENRPAESISLDLLAREGFM